MRKPVDQKEVALEHTTALMDQAEAQGEGNTAGVFRRVLNDLSGLPSKAFDFVVPDETAAPAAVYESPTPPASEEPVETPASEEPVEAPVAADPEAAKVAETFAPSAPVADGG